MSELWNEYQFTVQVFAFGLSNHVSMLSQLTEFSPKFRNKPSLLQCDSMSIVPAIKQ